MTSPKKDENMVNTNYHKKSSFSNQSELLEESKRLDNKIEETKRKIESIDIELKLNIKIYKLSEGEKKEKERSKCLDLIRRKKNSQRRLDNFYNQQFEIDQSYIKTEYLQDKIEIDRIIKEAKEKQKEIKYKSYVKEMAEAKSQMKEIKEKQDEFMEALMSYNYNLPDVSEETLDLELENMILEKVNNNDEFEYNIDELCKPNDRFLKSKQSQNINNKNTGNDGI